MNGADYWQERAEQNALRVFRYSDRKAQLVTRWFGRAQREMHRTITEFYRRYADRETLTLPQAKAALNDRRALSVTLTECRTLAQKSPLDPVLKGLLDKAYLSRAISRAEFLSMQLNLLASELYSDYAYETKKSLTEIFEETYYKGIFDYQQFIGFGSGFNRISTHQIEAATATAWKGSNYSARIWGNHRQTLARYLNRIVTNGFLQGQGNGEMAAALQKAMDMSAFDARRLIRTECAQVASRASLLAYGENGTPQFKFLATLDLRTSELCRSMDGKIFAAADGKIGVNMPPLHPFCRSTTVPHIPDEKFDGDNTRIARNGAGETYKVPAGMNYRDWHKKFVEGSPAGQLAETKLKHGTADAKQHKKYAALLGSAAPKTLDALQNMKYTGGGEPLRFLELDYRRRNRLRQNPTLALPNAASATAAAAKFTQYLFGGTTENGLAKGHAITSRLGYNVDNWQQFQKDILQKSTQYTALPKAIDEHGQRYEQKIVVNGLKGTPANVIVGWCEKDGKTWLTSAYIKEVNRLGD